MPEGHLGALGTAKVRPPRRWPMVAATTVLAASVLFTAALVARDRQNAAAASAARANAARDAVAFASLRRVSASINLADQLQHVGVLGLSQIGVHDFRSLVVSPLGGTLTTTQRSWTLSLGGGWACLTWAHSHHWSVPRVSRGVCSNAPIQATPAVSSGTLRQAVRNDAQAQRAALDAALVTAAFASTPQGYTPKFSLAALRDRFARLDDAAFRAAVTPSGVTIQEGGSVACVVPTATQQAVRVIAGACTP